MYRKIITSKAAKNVDFVNTSLWLEAIVGEFSKFDLIANVFLSLTKGGDVNNPSCNGNTNSAITANVTTLYNLLAKVSFLNNCSYNII